MTAPTLLPPEGSPPRGPGGPASGRRRWRAILVDAAAETFADALLASGIRIYRYRGGFLHSKHFLVDDRMAGIGTANFDNRSFRLNFEVTAVVVDGGFAAEVAAMFERDLARARALTRQDLASRSFFRRAFSRAALLFSPVL